jgi:SAM-dependent methyltransferase
MSTGWINLDRTDLPGVDVVADVEKGLPFDTDSVDEIRGSAFLEHIRDTLGFMEELHRVAKPNTLASFSVPYGSSDNAYADPTHVTRFFYSSWMYFSQPAYFRADYGYRGDWEIEDIYFSVNKYYAKYSLDEISKLIWTQRNVVDIMLAKLRAVKPIREAKRELIKRVVPKIALGNKNLGDMELTSSPP